MNVKFYINNSPKNQVSKNLSQITSKNCEAYDEISIMSNKLIVAKFDSIMKCNYCYNSALGRYYFIKNITMLDGNRALIECSIDVLETYSAQIKSNSGIIDKQQTLASYYMTDSQYPLESRRRTQIKTFPTMFTPNNGSFVLKVSGS